MTSERVFFYYGASHADVLIEANMSFSPNIATVYVLPTILSIPVK